MAPQEPATQSADITDDGDYNAGADAGFQDFEGFDDGAASGKRALSDQRKGLFGRLLFLVLTCGPMESCKTMHCHQCISV